MRHFRALCGGSAATVRSPETDRRPSAACAPAPTCQGWKRPCPLQSRASACVSRRWEHGLFVKPLTGRQVLRSGGESLGDCAGQTPVLPPTPRPATPHASHTEPRAEHGDAFTGSGSEDDTRPWARAPSKSMPSRWRLPLEGYLPDAADAAPRCFRVLRLGPRAGTPASRASTRPSANARCHTPSPRKRR